MQSHEWVLKRNCSITPRQLWFAYAAICTGSGMVALWFALRGAWYVLLFAVIELAAVGIAFLVFGRHATDRERVVLDGGKLSIEVVEADRTRSLTLNSRSARIDAPIGDGLVLIRCAGTVVEVGKFVVGARRRQFARELEQALRESRVATSE